MPSAPTIIAHDASPRVKMEVEDRPSVTSDYTIASNMISHAVTPRNNPLPSSIVSSSSGSETEIPSSDSDGNTSGSENIILQQQIPKVPVVPLAPADSVNNVSVRTQVSASEIKVEDLNIDTTGTFGISPRSAHTDAAPSNGAAGRDGNKKNRKRKENEKRQSKDRDKLVFIVRKCELHQHRVTKSELRACQTRPGGCRLVVFNKDKSSMYENIETYHHHMPRRLKLFRTALTRARSH
jgi:hypothetical protein